MQPQDIWQWVDFLRWEAMQDPVVARMSPPIREEFAFQHLLEQIPIRLGKSTAFAGAFAPDAPGKALAQRYRGRLADTSPETQADGDRQADPWNRLQNDFYCRISDGGRAHTTVDYQRVLTKGICGLVAEIEQAANAAPPEKAEFLTAMTGSLRALVTFAHRFATLAEKTAESAKNPVRKQACRALAERCRRVPAHPARSFHEALQAIWFVHLGIALSERSSASLSLGRLDQFLHPYHERDLADGLGAGRLADVLMGFLRMLNGFGDPACTINLGPEEQPTQSAGVKGRSSGFNALSRLIVRAVKTLKLPSPILAARISDNTPLEVFDQLTDPELIQIGQPTFYGETPCKNALRRRGIPRAELDRWAANSCMGLMMAGSEWSNMWGTVVNVLLPLELALNGGKPLQADFPFSLGIDPPRGFPTFGDLFESVCSYLDKLVHVLIAETERRTQRRGRAEPNPFVSALLDDCIERGQDRLLGGCRYHTVIVEAFGLINAADALTAIERLVYRENRFKLADLVCAAKRDFEHADTILKALHDIPKYGNGHTEPDTMARKLANRFADCVSSHSTPSLTYAPSFHTLAAHIPAGARTAASLDGRKAGKPLAKNIGTSPGRNREGHTALIRSAATIDQAAFFGGQALDLWIDTRHIQTQKGRRNLQDLIQTYFRLGGLQIQVNGVTPASLRAARKSPATHQHVLVRKAGYTARYVSLPETEQEELIARFEKENRQAP